MSGLDYSVVEYLPEKNGHRCGYCKSTDSYISNGMWLHSLGVSEYQQLLDRGWRRSGIYMYKPCMEQTCCPMYTIRCEVGGLHISKSQKKVLKRFYNFLRFGDTPKDFRSGAAGDSSSVEGDMCADIIPSHMEQATSQPAVVDLEKIEMDTSPSKEGQSSCINLGSNPTGDKKGNLEEPLDVNMPSTSTGKREDVSEDPPRQRKAKLIRLENKYNKLRRRGMDEEKAIKLTYEAKVTSPEKKALCFGDYFPCSEEMLNFTHKFRTELYPVTELESNEVLLQETYRLYVKYQVAVHGDSPEDCSMKQFKRFLVESPLYDSLNQGPASGFGSFHQQYWLDGRLIAVGVIDILPKCVSSVYFFYDPDLRSLSLGTYGSLHEMYYVRNLTLVCPTIKFYYLGYYIHSCPKMNYKGRYHPSYLLCPETYTWHRIEKCLEMLEKNKYSRFEADSNVVDKWSEVNLANVMILHKHRVMGYLKYKRMNPEADDEEEVREYAQLVGERCCQSIFLLRK